MTETGETLVMKVSRSVTVVHSLRFGLRNSLLDTQARIQCSYVTLWVLQLRTRIGSLKVTSHMLQVKSGNR